MISRRNKVIGISFLFGLLIWIVDAALDYFIFYERSFFELLVTDIPEHELYIRAVILFILVIYGFIVGFFVKKLDKSNKELSNLNHQLQAGEQQLKAINQQLDASNQQLSASEQQLRALNQQLSLSEEKYRTVFENTGAATCILEEDGTISLANKQFEILSGFSSEEIINKKKWMDFVVEEDLYWMREQHELRRKDNEKALKEYEFRFMNKNNAIKNIHLHVEIIPDTKKSVASLIDVTHMLTVEQELKSIEWMLKDKVSEGRYGEPEYGDLSEINKDGMILNYVGKEELNRIVGDYLDLLETSAAVYEKDGSYALGIMSSHWCQFLDVSSRKLTGQANNAAALSSGKWLCHESCWTHASKPCIEKGEIVDEKCHGGLSIYAVPIKAYGQIIGAINFGYGEPPKDNSTLEKIASKYNVSKEDVARNASRYRKRPQYIVQLAKKRLQRSAKQIGHIVESKMALNSLQESEQKFKKISENSPDAIFIADKNGKYVYVNEKASALLGYGREELLDMSVKDLSIISNDKEPPEIFKQILKNGSAYSEIEMRRKNGSTVAVDLNATLLPDGNVYGSCRDITERIINQTQLIEAKEKAEESDRLKSAFLANMSHEIRTPMNGIIGFTDLLKENNLSEEKHDKYIEVIQRSGRRMLNTVNDIIDISKIDSGQVELNVSEFSIKEELRSLISFFRPQAEAKNLAMSLNYNLDKKDDTMCADLTKFNSIVTNLVRNAIKFTGGGSIELGCDLHGEKRLFYVKDTGQGIPPERQEAIFNRFEQADIEDVHALEGSGLGLAISRSYVEMMGGIIWVDSEPGAGSVFYFTINSNCASNKQRIRNVQDVNHKDSKPDKQIKLLVAEDDDTSYEHLEIVLRQYTSKIVRAKDGIELLKILNSDRDIDLILMDIKMPRMNGYEAARKTREINKRIPIIAQTAYALPGDREKAIEAGCDDYIEKPIDRRLLIDLISKRTNQ